MDELRFDGRTAIVTGGNSGIGDLEDQGDQTGDQTTEGAHRLLPGQVPIAHFVS